jgi:hypothetical protein
MKIIYYILKNVGRKGIEPSIVATIEFTAQPVNQQTEPSFFFFNTFNLKVLKKY